MERPHFPDTIDTRIVFRVYAGFCVVAGIALLALPGGFRDLEAPVQAVAVRGAALLAAACAAMGLARVESPRDRHEALVWFANGHLVLLVALLSMSLSHDVPRSSEVYGPILAAATMLLYYFWQTGDGHRARESAEPVTLFPQGPHGDERLRSEYEERIREAAGQEERHRLARELHDSVKQQIFAMQTAAATVQARYETDPAGAREALDRLRASAREAMTEMEAMLDSLRASPLESAGLVEAIKRQAEALNGRLTVATSPGAGTTVTLRVPFGVRARSDVSDYRRRAVTWGSVSLLQALLVSRELATEQLSGYPVALLVVFAVVTARAYVAWRGARRAAESSTWIQSPSHS